MKPKIRPDISNIAGYHKFPPRARNIDLMFNNLKTEYWVKGIADWKLPHCIDNFLLYNYYKERGIITEAAKGIPADIPLILQAIQDDSLILTNDRFLDHMDIIPSRSWLYRHRVPFKIYDGEFRIYLPK